MPTAQEIVIDELISQMLLDGRRDEVQRLLAQFQLWQIDGTAAGPEPPAFPARDRSHHCRKGGWRAELAAGAKPGSYQQPAAWPGRNGITSEARLCKQTPHR